MLNCPDCGAYVWKYDEPMMTAQQRVVYLALKGSGYCVNCPCGFHTGECGNCGCYSVLPQENVA